MRFNWFWSFWHWSKESFREGALLRSPLHGVASHWDEWFRHEATESEIRAIEQTGINEVSQRQFIAWLLWRWAAETDLRRNGLAQKFVLGQLAQVAPFSRWTAFEKYRRVNEKGGMPAIVLGEKSPGEPEDIRAVEAVMLPADATAPAVVADGFQADIVELYTPRRAAMNALAGRGFWMFFALWLAAGKRAYPKWLKYSLSTGWLVTGGLLLYLLLGPDPGRGLYALSGALLVLWTGSTGIAVIGATVQGIAAWLEGQKLTERLEQSQTRLRMEGGLTLKGGSAGLVFCVNILEAIRRAAGIGAGRSWLWRNFFSGLRAKAGIWSATGVITVEGKIRPVVLESKLRACMRQGGVHHLIVPRQAGSGAALLVRDAEANAPVAREKAPTASLAGQMRFGFAAENRYLRVHSFRHIAQVMMRLGDLMSRAQAVFNVVGVAVTCAMLFALPGLRGILLPPPAPLVVAPSSPSPNYLWVSLNTKHPESFRVVLESRYWSNRRADVLAHKGANASARAEIRLHRQAGLMTGDMVDGTVWVERRYKLLTREFAPGERVGSYSLSYVNALGYE